jgi:hypothetical protein
MCDLQTAKVFSSSFPQNVVDYAAANSDNPIVQFLNNKKNKFTTDFIYCILLYLVRDGYDEVVYVANRNKNVYKDALKTFKYAKSGTVRRLYLRDYLSYFFLCKFLNSK